MNELRTLFAWATSQADAAASLPPLAIHQSSYPRDHTVRALRGADTIRARPFTVAFENYVDGEDQEAPILTALADIHSDPSLRLEFEVVWAVVVGRHTDLELLRAVLGRPNGFDEVARRGLSLLRDKTVAIVQKQVSDTAQRRERAGEAQKARDDEIPMPKRRKKVYLDRDGTVEVG